MLSSISLIRNLIRDSSGASAIEFALVAPVLITAVLFMVDIGLAVSTRMELNRDVRAGAQAAMSLNNDTSAIQAIALASSGSPEGTTVNVAGSCACGSTVSACQSLCGNGTAPSVFIAISAIKPYDGLFLGRRNLEASTRVQIR